jgi:tRNA(Ile)-lysidine synthase
MIEKIPNRIYEKFVLRIKSIANILEKNKKIVVAVSGGPDSMFLLLLLYKFSLKNKIDIIPIYINHHVRTKKEIKKDIEVINDFCKKINLQLIIEEIFPEKKDENTLRELRYKKLFEVAQRQNASIIATGHTKDDVVETFFINLLRGSGIKGLCSIPSLREEKHDSRTIYILRPIIDITKDEIVKILSQQKINFVVDKTNLKILYRRNLLRNRIFPMFKNLNPNFKDNIISTIEHFKEINDFISQQIEKYLAEVKINKNFVCIDLKKFLMYNNLIKKEILHKLLPKIVSQHKIKIRQGYKKVVETITKFLTTPHKNLRLTKNVFVSKSKKWLKIQIN